MPTVVLLIFPCHVTSNCEKIISYFLEALTISINKNFFNAPLECRRKYFFLHRYEGEMFYLTMHSTHFINGYMASDIWLRTILIVRKETCCCHIGYSYRLTAMVLLYAPSHYIDINKVADISNPGIP